MDLMQDREEDSKYAFLLGSALRNDDTEQLFVVYDNLIPSGISDCRLERIKEGARYISELPECDFNALVLNARTFSLASGRSSTVGSMSMDNQSGRRDGLYHDEDEEGEAVSIIQGEKASTTRYGSLNLQASLKPTSSKNVDDVVKLDFLCGDQDSGCRGSSSFKENSSKNSSSESNSEDERPGCHDYFLTSKSQTEGHVRIRPTLNPDYDEDIKVDSSTGGSSVESPRSETSVSHEECNLGDDVEMQVFNHSSQDFRRVDDSYPTSVTAVNEHQHLYGLPKHNHDRVVMNSYNLRQDTVLGNSTGAAGQKKSRVSMGARGYSKDDSDKVTSPVGLDVNGNPPVQDLGTLDLANYHQMRLPGNASKVVEGGNSSLSAPSNQTPLSLGEPDSELGKKLRRKKRHPKQKSQLSESVDDFKGNEPIEDLLSFIEGGDNINNHKKIQPQNSSGGGGKTEKQKKKQEKNKDDLNGQEDKTTANSIKTIKSSPSVIQPSLAVMGNSAAKDTHEDNEVTTTTTTTVSLIVPSSIKKNTVAAVEDHDHNSSEFFDCLNSPPGDDNKSQQKSSLFPDNVQNISESNLGVEKQETTVCNKNSKNDAKNLSVLKGNGKKYKNAKIEDLADNNESSQLSLSKQKAESIESCDAAPNSSDVKIEDLAAQESTQAFIEVKKKKKRNVSSFTNFQQQNHSYYPKDTNGQSSHNKPWRPQRPFQTWGAAHGNNTTNSNVVESNKPSSLIVQSSKDNASLDTFSRDLSPSSFPVLMCHTNTSSNIGSRPERRNSCGDINDVKADVVSETRSYCDSDRESVKSLPAAHNVRATGESSPLYPVSYATMLVTAQRERRHNGDSSNSPSSESGIVCDSQTSSINSYHPHSSLEMVSPPPAQVSNDAICSGCASTPDRKTTVWKGSPRERRHSIGSSPDDNKPETDTVNSRHRQKSGSQECLAMNVASSSQSNLPGMKEATSKELSNSALSSSQVQITHDPGNVESLDTVTADSCQQELCNKSIPNSPKDASSQSTQSSVSPSVDYHRVSLEMGGGNNLSKVTSVSKRTSTEKQSRSTDTATTKKGNTNNIKSVIFLDERFGNNKATDLGITFGFDSSIEPALDFQSSSSCNTASVHQNNQALMSLVTSSNVTTSLPLVSSSSVVQQHKLSTPVSPASSSISSSNIPATSTRSPYLSSSSLSSSSSEPTSQHQSSDNVKQPPLVSSSSTEKIKGPLTSNPSNGLVIPPVSVVKGSATTTASLIKPKISANVSSATTSTTTSNSQISSENKDNVMKTGNETNSSQNEDAISSSNCGKNNNSSRPPATTASISGNLLSQQSMVSHHASEKLKNNKVTHTIPHPPNNQQHPSHVVPSHPNANNSPIVIPPHAFIGQKVLFSPHFPPPPIHPQVVPMPPPLPSATVITAVQPSTNLITKKQSSDIPIVSASSIPTAVASAPSPQSLSASSNDSATVTSPITSTTSNAKTESTPTQPLDNPIKVVYGLRIKPDGGCGTILFRPSHLVNKKQKKNNLAELSGLLKRKWTEVKDLDKEGLEKFITIGE